MTMGQAPAGPVVAAADGSLHLTMTRPLQPVIPAPSPPFDLPGLVVLQRGWLSSNQVLLNDDAGAVLIDSGHGVHAEQTLALVAHALGGRALRRLINTHLHSDHCGGNAALQARFGCDITVPAPSFEAVQQWDREALSHAPTGQWCERFAATQSLAPGERFTGGDRQWQVHAAPGHDPHSLIFFEPQSRLLVAADALWENGFGVVFPTLDAAVDQAAFDEVEATLALIETLEPAGVIPGHGAPFTDVAAALERARARLAAFRASPAKHLSHGLKVLLKYHLMECGSLGWPALRQWWRETRYIGSVWQRLGGPDGSLEASLHRLVAELERQGAVRSDALAVHDA